MRAGPRADVLDLIHGGSPQRSRAQETDLRDAPDLPRTAPERFADGPPCDGARLVAMATGSSYNSYLNSWLSDMPKGLKTPTITDTPRPGERPAVVTGLLPRRTVRRAAAG